MIKIKICGITSAYIAKNLSIDAIGLVFYEKSPRFVNIGTANDIIKSLPPFINRVGLFVNASSSYIDKILNSVAIDTLQFHGDETPTQCEQYKMPYIKAIRVNNNTNITKYADEFNSASALLLDSNDNDYYGGSGKSFDWHLAKIKINKPIILAGGLNADNVQQAIKITKPYGIDVSSGVEIKKGVKDLIKIKQFVIKVNTNGL